MRYSTITSMLPVTVDLKKNGGNGERNGEYRMMPRNTL